MGSNNVTANFNTSALEGTTCYESADGVAEITGIGGGLTAPFNVYWTNTTGLYESTLDVGTGFFSGITNLTGGAWVVTVTDQNGCAWSHFFTVDQPDEILIDFNTNNPTCHLFSDGSVTAIPTGGNGGNSYVLTNSAGTQLNMGGIPVVNTLTEGWYFATISDSQGCTGTDSIYLEAPDEINVDITITDLICSYDSDGSIVVDSVYNNQGAYGSISYYWNPNPNGTNGVGSTSITNINGGNYSLTVNDAFGCSNVFDLHVSPDELYFIEIGSEPYSTSMDGVVYAAADGGTPSYIYTWTNLANGSTHNGTVWGGLQPGEYQIMVTDGNGCILIDTVTIGYLGANEINAEKKFRIYPKLVQHSVLYVENSTSSETNFSLYNLSGALVFSSNLNHGTNELLLDLSSGSYIYTVQGNELQDDVLTRGKIVIAGN